MIIFVVRFAPARPTVLYAALTGVLLALLATTRTFELIAFVLAWGIAAVGFAALRLSSSRSWSLRRVLAGVTAFVATTVVVYAATGKRDLFFLYENSLDNQSGDVARRRSRSDADPQPRPRSGEARPALPRSLLPLLVQDLRLRDGWRSGYESRLLEPAARHSVAGALRSPALASSGPAGSSFAAVRHRARTSGGRELRLLVEMTVAATGLTLGYVASSLTGPSHLRYGFARDFLLASLLAAVVIVVLACIAGWHLVARRRGGLLSPDAAFVVAAVVSAVLVVVGVTYAQVSRPSPVRKQTSRKSRLHGELRRGRVRRSGGGHGSGRTPIDIPGASTLTFGCGSDEPSFTLYVPSLTAGVRVPSECQSPRLVAGWPTVMGLPPGSFELAAVDVRNV